MSNPTCVGKINDNETLVFTEENFPISVICFECSTEYDSSMFAEYFQKYGKILYVRLLVQSRRYTNIHLVHFAQPEGAAKFLRPDLRRWFGIAKPACSWYQPDGQRFIENLNKSLQTSNSYEMKQEKDSILNLNDDSLEEICNLLYPKDEINFALTCRRFWRVSEMASIFKYKYLNYKMIANMTPFQIRLFIGKVGPHIKSLTIDSMEWTVHEVFSSFCPNVKKLKATNVFKTKQQLVTYINKMPLLEELELSGIEFEDNFIESLKSLKNLKYLSITNTKNTTFENIDDLCRLQKLSLMGCYNLKSCCFRKMCEKLKDLAYLDIIGCKNLITEDLEYIAQHLLKLKTLKVSVEDMNINCLTQLPNLKELEIDNDFYPLPDEFFYNLSKFEANQLEKLKLNAIELNMAQVSYIAKLKKLKILHIDSPDNSDIESLATFSQLTDIEEIYFICCELTDEDILLILEGCGKLHRLKLDGCTGPTPNILIEAKQLLKQQQRSCTITKECCSGDTFTFSITINKRNDKE